MNSEIFREGGPLNIQHIGGDQYRMHVSIPSDEDGRIARECPADSCTPGYFKVMPGTGIQGDHAEAFCPYCRSASEPGDFATAEQLRYAEEIAVREARRGVDAMIAKTLGLDGSGRRKIGGGMFSIEMSYRPSPLQYVSRPYEDEVRRDVVCPHCGLDHTVFGLATWCADCGRDIFLCHVRGELEVVRRMVGDIDRRREVLGKRVAAKDMENGLEDAVSIFEAALKATVRHVLVNMGATVAEIDAQFKKIGVTFQNIERTRATLSREPYSFKGGAEADWGIMAIAFPKRHPITHNLGVVDRRYLEIVAEGEHRGREVRIGTAELEAVLASCANVIEAAYRTLVKDKTTT